MTPHRLVNAGTVGYTGTVMAIGKDKRAGNAASCIHIAVTPHIVLACCSHTVAAVPAAYARGIVLGGIPDKAPAFCGSISFPIYFGGGDAFRVRRFYPQGKGTVLYGRQVVYIGMGTVVVQLALIIRQNWAGGALALPILIKVFQAPEIHERRFLRHTEIKQYITVKYIIRAVPVGGVGIEVAGIVEFQGVFRIGVSCPNLKSVETVGFRREVILKLTVDVLRGLYIYLPCGQFIIGK